MDGKTKWDSHKPVISKLPGLYRRGRDGRLRAHLQTRVPGKYTQSAQRKRVFWP